MPFVVSILEATNDGSGSSYLGGKLTLAKTRPAAELVDLARDIRRGEVFLESRL